MEQNAPFLSSHGCRPLSQRYRSRAPSKKHDLPHHQPLHILRTVSCLPFYQISFCTLEAFTSSLSYAAESRDLITSPGTICSFAATTVSTLSFTPFPTLVEPPADFPSHHTPLPSGNHSPHPCDLRLHLLANVGHSLFTPLFTVCHSDTQTYTQISHFSLYSLNIVLYGLSVLMNSGCALSHSCDPSIVFWITYFMSILYLINH